MEKEKLMTKRKRRSTEKARRREKEEWKIANRMFPTLPSHVVMDIVSRLPIQYQLICKHDLNFSPNKPYLLYRRLRTRGYTRKFSLIDLNNANTHKDVVMKLEFRPRINLPDLKFEFVHSCNGLLCLYSRNHRGPFYICNPILGEYFSTCYWDSEKSFFEFGFSPKTKQYKILFSVEIAPQTFYAYVRRIGGGRSYPYPIEIFPFVPKSQSSNSYLNGALHWVDCDHDSSVFIHSFDFDDELCKVLPPPAHFGANQKKKSDSMNVGVLRGYLYITDVAFDDHFDIWVMKDYGIAESWVKVFTVRTSAIMKKPEGHYEPIMVTKGGEILMIVDNQAFVSYDPVLDKCVNLGICGRESKIEAFVFVPNLTSIKGLSHRVRQCKKLPPT